jgi:hypothetical protein
MSQREDSKYPAPESDLDTQRSNKDDPHFMQTDSSPHSPQQPHSYSHVDSDKIDAHNTW